MINDKFKNWLFLVFILIICGSLIYWLPATSNKNNDLADIRVASIKFDTLKKNISIYGVVLPKLKKNITARIDGYIKKISLSDSESIGKGDEILKINSPIEQEKFLAAKQKILEAEYNLEIAKKELDRIERLFKLNHASESQVENIKLNIERLNHSILLNAKLLNLQKEKLLYLSVKAPISGILLFEENIEEGLFVKAGQLLCSIIDPDSIVIQAFINQYDAKNIFLNQPVILNSLDHDNTLGACGKISFIAPQIKAGMLRLLIQVNDNHYYKIGTSIKVDISINTSASKFLVPIEAIRIINNDTFLFTLEDMTIKKKKVDIGENNHSLVEIENGEGLQSGTRVIVSHFHQISDGMKITSYKEINNNDRRD